MPIPFGRNDNNNFQLGDSTDFLCFESIDSPQEVGTSVSFSFSREESVQYFQHEFHGLGAAYLVGYSCFEQNNIAELLNVEEVELQIKLPHLRLQ